MSRSTEPSTASQTITSEPAAVPLIGRRSGATGSGKMQAALMRERGSWDALTEQDHARIKAEREADRAKAIESAPWRKASLTQLLKRQYDLPVALVHDTWCDLSELLPPDLADWQIEEVEQAIEVVEADMLAAGPEATAVILRKLAAVVIIPERDDMDLAMEAYLEDLQGYPEHVLDDVTKMWRRNEKFWPTISELCRLCNEHDEGLGANRANLRRLYPLRAVGKNPAPDLLVTSEWIRDRKEEARTMCLNFDRFTPRKRISHRAAPTKPRLALVGE